MLRRLLLLIALFSFTQIIQAQTTVTDTFNFDGFTRDYILYVPAIYDGTNPVPLVINLHGYGSNASQQNFYGNFKNLADVDNFLVVHPNGTNDLSGTRYWNAFVNGGAVDDVAFINGLIDTLALTYNIDMTKIFSTGMSNGGFMSFKLACELSGRIAKIASVTGSMNTTLQNTCSPTNPVPVMQIHGTADPTVAYDGSIGVMAIEDVVDFWVDKNNCDPTPVTTPVPDNDPNDGCTAERIVYSNGDNNSEVIFYKITGGGHTWPGAPIGIPGNATNRDFNASEVIWEFFKGEPFVGIRARQSLGEIEVSYGNNELFVDLPDKLSQLNMYVLNSLGQVVLNPTSKRFSTSSLNSGMYFVHVSSTQGIFTQSFIKYE